MRINFKDSTLEVNPAFIMSVQRGNVYFVTIAFVAQGEPIIVPVEDPKDKAYLDKIIESW